MRNCPNCGHKFSEKEVAPPECPSCGRQFTVSDVGSATVEAGPFGSLELRPTSGPTVMEGTPSFPKSPVIPAALADKSLPSRGTVADDDVLPAEASVSGSIETDQSLQVESVASDRVADDQQWPVESHASGRTAVEPPLQKEAAASGGTVINQTLPKEAGAGDTSVELPLPAESAAGGGTVANLKLPKEFVASGSTSVDLPLPEASDASGGTVVSRKPPKKSDASGGTVSDRAGLTMQSESWLPSDMAESSSDHTGLTLQSGRWFPTAEEIADAGPAEEILKTIDSSFLGPAAPSPRSDKTIDSSFLGPPALAGGSDRTIESSYISASPASPSAPKSRDATEMWDSSHPLSESAMLDLAAKAGSSQVSAARSAAGRTSPSARFGSQSIQSESLEQSLVIQPRILRPEDASSDRTGDRIDYNLLKKLGEGGMGIVYAARQQSIRRVVALKMLKKAGEQETFQREKFLAEAVITGDLEHPNIVPIYDLGRDEAGAIFYAMKHVKGTPWDITVKKNSTHENLDVLMKVADAVAFAHSRDVVHRDLKPENVMLGDFGEVLVMDWGLALTIGSPAANVAMGGTPGYMAPEMAMGPIDAIGFHSDVYLLGAILFEIVTGLRPHTGKTITRCLMSAAKNEIVTTDKSGELIDIAYKAMSTKAANRYTSVRDFQAAVRQYQSHIESIALGVRAQDDLDEARRTDKYDTFARALFAYQEAFALWDGNSRAQAGAIEAAQAYAESAERKGDYDLGLSLLDTNEAVHLPVMSRLQKARDERESRKRRLRTARRIGMALAASLFVIVTGAFFWIRAKEARARVAEAQARTAEGVAKQQEAEAVRQKGVAENQRTIAVAAQQEAVAAQQQEANQRKEADKQRMLAEEQTQVAVEQKRVADEQRTQAVAARQEAVKAQEQEEYEAYVARIGLAAAKIDENAFDHALQILSDCPAPRRNWEWGRLKYLCMRDQKSYDCGEPLEAIALSADGARLAAGGWGGDVRIFDVNSGQQLAAFPTGGNYVFALAFSPDGRHVAAGTNANPAFVSIWDAVSGKLVRNLNGHSDAVLSVAFSRDGGQLLTGSYDSTARLWNIESGTSREFRGHDWWVWSAAFSPDEKRLVTASQDGSALVWSVASGKPSAPFLGHQGPVYSASFSPDGTQIASASYDKRVLLWRPDDLKSQDLDQVINRALSETTVQQTPFVALEGHTAAVRCVRYSSDGKLIVSGGNDNAVCIWDTASRQLFKTLRGHASSVSTVLFVPGNEQVISGAYDHLAKLWNISKYEEVRLLGGRVFKGHRDSVLGAAFSPDGKTVVTASRDRSAVAWDVDTGKQLRSFTEGHGYLASAALFFPDGKRVLTSAVDNTTRIWDMAKGTQIATLEGTGASAAVALSHDGQWIATGSDDKELRIWDPNGKLLRKFPGFTSEVTALAISPDDQSILTGDGVGRCRLLQADTGKVIWESRSHSATITAAYFLPGGRKVLTSSLDNTVAQWDVATGQEDAKRLLKHPQAVTSFVISGDGTRALTACTDRIVRLWDIERAGVVRELPASDVATTDVAFSPDASRALTVTNDNRVHLWDLATGREIFAPGEKEVAFLDLSGTKLVVWSGTFSSDGSRLLTVGGAEAHLWNLNDAKPLVTFSPQSAVSSVQYSSSGDQIVTGGWDNSARIWNAATGAALRKLAGVHTRFVNASVFSPDGSQVLTASDDKTVRLWDAATSQLVRSFVGHDGRVTDVAFSSDGKWVVTASDDKTARIWDAATGGVLHVLQGHSQAVLCARFSNDNTRVITGSDDTTALLWDAATGKSLNITLAGHTAAVTSVAFTPDGARAMTGSKDITAKLWDPNTGKEILTLAGHKEEITTVAFSPDGTRILTGSRDGTAIVWLTVPWSEQAQVALLKPLIQSGD